MKKIFIIIGFVLICLVSKAQVQILQQKIEHLINPIGIDQSNPSLSWVLASENRNIKQKAYEIRVSENSKMEGQCVWQTGKIISDQSINITYTGLPLKSGQKYYWQVRVWDNQEKQSGWSQVAYWQMACLQKSYWKAKWIEPDYNEDSNNRVSPLFRKSFKLKKEIRSALVYITSHGMYEASINGKRVGNNYLTPGWTSYNKRLQYQVYDVTSQLKKGDNAIGVTLGSGWYRSYLTWYVKKNLYGKSVGLFLQLDVTYTDGSKALIVSDDSWKSSTGSIQSSEIYFGETIDKNKEKVGWQLPGYDDRAWNGVNVVGYPTDNLIATYNEPVRKQETLTPIKVITTPKGETVLDFGQNLVGWDHVIVKGSKGDTVRIYHAEVLDKEGNFYTANLRSAKATSTYILSGNGTEVFEPHFTYYGFRYIKVEGVKGNLIPENFSAIVLHSDITETGKFTTSNHLINQLQSNIKWGQKGNFVDIPSDCPQRDERLGWTGDAHAFFRTATFNRGVENFFTKWLKDLAADQHADGRVPFVIPDVLADSESGSSGWSDASTIIPWQMYMAYGNTRVLEQQYPSMKAWVDFMKNNSKDYLWNKGFHFGDWLFYRPDDDRYGISAVTDKSLITQCFYAHSTQMLINTARVLGNETGVKEYTELLDNIKNAFVREFVTPNGRMVSGTQTAYVLALYFDMLPESLRTKTAERLVENISNYKNHLTTGFLGTPYICHVLSQFGYDDVAYKLLLQETYPSWLYPVKSGATTIWERWDGQKPDGTFQSTVMNSFNHYAYGAIGDWLYRVVAGLQEDAPGYKAIIVKPHLGGDLTHVAAELMTPYGKAVSSWKLENEKLIMVVEIPPNTSATIYIPSKSADLIQESGKALSSVKEIDIIGQKGDYIIVKTGSGKYSFSIKNK
ncbi:MAG: family 78 glycoside hydrolase catalytic domain [Bacteroidetes bacterium]|nr:family 78 glycoside hydrolase catalytic domain [Bacteroidota bacterium]